jgi:hypothetical protein
MKGSRVIFLLIGIQALLFSACNREGCTDPNANNYKEKAETDDGTCRYDSEAFEGRWAVTDSLQVFGSFLPEPPKTLDIRVQTLNRSKVKFFFRFDDGSYSDTLEANAKTNALSIPEQTWNDTLVFQGNFTVARIGGIKLDYQITNENVGFYYRGVASEL